MLARDCGVYANRNPAAHEVRDDEGSLWCAFGDFPRNGKVTPPAGTPPHRCPSSVAPRQLSRCGSFRARGPHAGTCAYISQARL